MSCECKWNIKFPTLEFLYSFYHYNKLKLTLKYQKTFLRLKFLLINKLLLQLSSVSELNCIIQWENIWLYNTSCIGVNCSGEIERSGHRWKIMLKQIVQKWSGSVWTTSLCFCRGINDRPFWTPWLVTGCHKMRNLLTGWL
jgi:hypothetical protein